MISRRVLLWTTGVLAVVAVSVTAQDPPDRPMLQYFEAKWDTIRYRMPDVFVAGYGRLWLPPPSKGQGGAADIGYAVFDRFDLGTTSAPTRYGTESSIRLMIGEAHRANVEVTVDWIMNHNGTWDKNTSGFLANGGYPGFVLEVTGVDPDGDFHAYSGGCPQSTSPGTCYDLYNGRLLGLIDIAQEKNHLYFRHPTQSDPNNIPAGLVYNQPNAANAKKYGDTALPAQMITNPGTSRHPGSSMLTFYPFNLNDPMAGDPVLENATGVLLRATRWMLEVIGIDGFRLDAAKHIPTSFWDVYWDTAVYNRHRRLDGTYGIPFSYVEAVIDNGTMVNWVRRPGEPGSGTGWPAQGWEFGNRDALDLNEAGQLRDLVSADGSGSWENVMNASVDNVDGFNNGTIGVHHTNSHDNAIADDENDFVADAYVFMRTGQPNVYYCAREFGAPPGNFPRANGRDDAIGVGGNLMTRLVQIRNGYARGWFYPINSTDPVNQSAADVLVFTRRTPNSVDNLLVALNDRENAGGVETRNVQTAFPNGTRLHELTGNATDPVVDPSGQIPDVLLVTTVDGSPNRLVDANNVTNKYLKVPSNRNASSVLHGRGYVIYGPAAPSGTLSIVGASQVLPPDDASVPEYRRRITPIHVITENSFTIRLQTTQTDPLDPNTDDFACFRIDAGFQDYNGNAAVDHPTGFQAGAENFLTVSSPRFTGGIGLYEQTIDATQLSEGFHYISVWAFRHRDDGGLPIFTDFRAVILVDRVPPVVTLVAPTQTGSGDIPSSTYQFVATVDDPDVQAVHFLIDQHYTTDMVAAANAGNLATRDGTTYRRTFNGLIKGNHRLDVVVFNSQGTPSVTTYTNLNSTASFFGGLGDLNSDFAIDGDDLAPFIRAATDTELVFRPAGDFNGDGLNNSNDIPSFVQKLLGL
ncbi:MAG: hypothetical protein L6Q92_12360 [Phycisphaerae bacterium]|nr:hypothetical protein [Phycisphaerae bacterium]